MNAISSSSSMSAVSSHSSPRRRALVLGGGGSTGNAWLIGVLAGLTASGVDPAAADRVIGTSAGATAAAQLAGATPVDLLDAILGAPARSAHAEAAARPAQSSGAANRRVVDHLDRTHRLIAESSDAHDLRRRLGASALERLAADNGSWQDRWRATVASRLPQLDWPTNDVLLTAVDATTGDPVVLDRNSGADLADAVAASTSSGLPYRVGDRWLIDGGFRRNENADLASGFERVLVLAPFSGRASPHPSGACSWMLSSPSCAHPAARSRHSSPARRSTTCSARTPWTCRSGPTPPRLGLSEGGASRKRTVPSGCNGRVKSSQRGFPGEVRVT